MGCGGNKQKMPSFTTKIANLGQALLKWGLAGFPTVNETVYRQRLDTCSTCEMLVDDTVCKHPQCGCPVARKASLATENCPLGKWVAETGENVVPPKAIPQQAPTIVTRPQPQPKKSKETCSHLRIVGHVFFDKTKSDFPEMNVTAFCRDCGTKMMFPDFGYTEKLTLKIRPKPIDEAGT